MEKAIKWLINKCRGYVVRRVTGMLKALEVIDEDKVDNGDNRSSNRH
ncbi:hypothetical protein [Portibacter marinus]|nr:hypothetical protein [Portibacter marinus]